MHERNERGGDEVVIRESNGVPPTLIGVIVLAILAVIFVLQNRTDAEVKFLFFTFQTQVWVAIALALIIGVLLGWLLVTMLRRRRR